MSDSKNKETASISNEGARTLLGVKGQNQLQQIAIADNKAIMITAICTALIFLIIALFSSSYFMEDDNVFNEMEFVLPMGILLAFSSLSIIFGILALKPKIVRTKNESRSSLFFNNYYRMSLEDYTEEINELLHSEQKIYNHMIKDIYHNGLVLQRKYALLNYAYTIFLLAILCSVSSYILASII